MNAETKRLRKSYYSFFELLDNGNYLIYSTLTGAAVLCNQPKYTERAKAIAISDEIVYNSDDELTELLYKKMILVDIDFDELLYIRSMCEEELIRNSNLHLMMIVTRDCDFDCAYCGQKHENKRMPQSVYDSAIKYIKQSVARKDYSSVTISFFGGEPLLEYNNIVYFLKQLAEISSELGFNYNCGMTTNAYLLSPDRFKTLCELRCLDYQITLDGMAESHNKTRYLKTGKPTWDRIVYNLIETTKTDFDFYISLRSNFNYEVFEKLEEFYDFVKDNLFDERIELYYETIKDHGNVNTPTVIRGVEEIVSDSQIAKMIKSRGLRSATAFKNPCSLICRASLPNYFVVDFGGELKKCSHLLDYPGNQIGQLNEDGSTTLNVIENSKWVYRDFMTRDDCKDCKILPLCMGKRCPIDLVNNCFRCDKALREVDVIETLKAYC